MIVAAPKQADLLTIPDLYLEFSTRPKVAWIIALAQTLWNQTELDSLPLAP